ncbi:unnamed protein product [Protopolystoma xenopodis]|uniref:Uncharacterized protein n=1 Tax=Protopolystoma xenopodis TaxID=117903 RepID=A0A3S5FD50_9PLAT|nr:unnamed protein product [Protopolystoma xenopodis]
MLYFHLVQILEWPECSVQGNRDEDQQLKESITSGFSNPVVNSVEMSSDGYYLAAVTDNNLVCIWRYAPPQTPLPATTLPPGSAAAVAAAAAAAAAGPQPTSTPTANMPMSIPMLLSSTSGSTAVTSAGMLSANGRPAHALLSAHYTGASGSVDVGLSAHDLSIAVGPASGIA